MGQPRNLQKKKLNIEIKRLKKRRKKIEIKASKPKHRFGNNAQENFSYAS